MQTAGTDTGASLSPHGGRAYAWRIPTGMRERWSQQGRGESDMDPQAKKNEGRIVNPKRNEGPDTSVGDEGDDANELRFDEEERLIREQSQRPETD